MEKGNRNMNMKKEIIRTIYHFKDDKTCGHDGLARIANQRTASNVETNQVLRV